MRRERRDENKWAERRNQINSDGKDETGKKRLQRRKEASLAERWDRRQTRCSRDGGKELRRDREVRRGRDKHKLSAR